MNCQFILCKQMNTWIHLIFVILLDECTLQYIGCINATLAPSIAPNWVRIRTFLSKMVQKRSDLATKTLNVWVWGSQLRQIRCAWLFRTQTKSQTSQQLPFILPYSADFMLINYSIHSFFNFAVSRLGKTRLSYN